MCERDGEEEGAGSADEAAENRDRDNGVDQHQQQPPQQTERNPVDQNGTIEELLMMDIMAPIPIHIDQTEDDTAEASDVKNGVDQEPRSEAKYTETDDEQSQQKERNQAGHNETVVVNIMAPIPTLIDQNAGKKSHEGVEELEKPTEDIEKPEEPTTDEEEPEKPTTATGKGDDSKATSVSQQPAASTPINKGSKYGESKQDKQGGNIDGKRSGGTHQGNKINIEPKRDNRRDKDKEIEGRRGGRNGYKKEPHSTNEYSGRDGEPKSRYRYRSKENPRKDGRRRTHDSANEYNGKDWEGNNRKRSKERPRKDYERSGPKKLTYGAEDRNGKYREPHRSGDERPWEGRNHQKRKTMGEERPWKDRNHQKSYQDSYQRSQEKERLPENGNRQRRHQKDYEEERSWEDNRNPRKNRRQTYEYETWEDKRYKKSHQGRYVRERSREDRNNGNERNKAWEKPKPTVASKKTEEKSTGKKNYQDHESLTFLAELVAQVKKEIIKDLDLKPLKTNKWKQ